MMTPAVVRILRVAKILWDLRWDRNFLGQEKRVDVIGALSHMLVVHVC